MTEILHHKTVGPDISYDDLPTNSSNAADADVKLSSGFAGGGMSSNEGDNYLEEIRVIWYNAF